MTVASTGAWSAVTFAVDGRPYAGGPVTLAVDQTAVAVCTADAASVARALPSRDLHPLRWFNGRAVLMLEAWDGVMRVGDLPPMPHGAVYLYAMVTRGRSTAPPVLPAVGEFVPALADVVGRRYGPGVCMLVSIATNRVAAEMARVTFGVPGSVGEIRRQRDGDAVRYAVADAAGGIMHLEVPTGGRDQSADATSLMYCVPGADLLGLSLRNVAAHASMRLGGSSTRLDVGQHAWARLAGDLKMASRPLWSQAQADSSVALEQAPERLGAADRGMLAPAQPIEPDPVQAPLIIRHEDGRETVIDQRLDRLPFHATGTFEHPGA